MKKIVSIDSTRCSGCGRCIAVCSGGALSFVSSGFRKHVERDADAKCILCGLCSEACPLEALVIEPAGKKLKQRLDLILVERGLAPSREKGQALIMAGMVVVDDHLADKPGKQVAVDAEIRLKGEILPFVSRGGLKLQHALDHFSIDVTGLSALDVGASTGGFTDCLLQRGAAKVYAVDVGHNQLAWKLRQDARVISMEKTNIRHLQPEAIPEKVDIAVIDASFISLAKVLPSTISLVKDGGIIIPLVKPQFEVGRGEVGKGGIVRDPKAHDRVVREVEELAAKLGLTVKGVTESPITGADGNREFLMLLGLDSQQPQLL